MQNPKLTGESFVTVEGGRYMVTGDVGEWTPDGAPTAHPLSPPPPPPARPKHASPPPSAALATREAARKRMLLRGGDALVRNRGYGAPGALDSDSS